MIDREHGVILERSTLLGGQPYERGFFSDLAFDLPLAPDLFTISSAPDTIER